MVLVRDYHRCLIFPCFQFAGAAPFLLRLVFPVYAHEFSRLFPPSKPNGCCLCPFAQCLNLRTTSHETLTATLQTISCDIKSKPNAPCALPP